MGKKQVIEKQLEKTIKSRETDKLDRIFLKLVNGQELTENEQKKFDRYTVIIGLRTSGFSGRLLMQSLTTHKSGLFSDLSESHINKLVSECNKHFGDSFVIDKKAERMFLALQYEELALMAKKKDDLNNHFRYSQEAAKLKGLYEEDATEIKVQANKIVLSFDEKAVKRLQGGVDFEDVEEADEDSTHILE
jgi:hypothetical protein